MKNYNEQELPPCKKSDLKLAGKDVLKIVTGFLLAYAAVAFLIICFNAIAA